MNQTTELIEVVYALEGEPKPFAIGVPAEASNKDILALIQAKHKLPKAVKLFWEDEDEALDADISLLNRLRQDFRQIHVGRSGKIEVTATYNRKTAERKFGPNATIRRVIKWAISDTGLDLVGKPAEFQIKFDGKIVPPETHLGQLAQCDKSLELTLVHNIKPQG